MLAPAVLAGDATAAWVAVASKSPLITAEAPTNPLGATGRLPESPELGQDALPTPGEQAQAQASGLPDGSLGIPGAALAAYRKAEEILARTTPTCHLNWSLLAGIGRIESGHAEGGAVDAKGDTLRPILGPRLDGSSGFAAIPATDGGKWTGDPVWDHAVGPMQFIPSTWRAYAAISNAKGYGEANPNNVYDSALAAGNYLCAAGGDMRNPLQRAAAVFNYNHSDEYVRTVLLWADAYASGVSELPDASGVPPVLPLAFAPPPMGPPSTIPTTTPTTSTPTTTVTTTPTSTTTVTTTTTATSTTTTTVTTTPTTTTTTVTTTTTSTPTCPTTTTTTTSTTTPSSTTKSTPPPAGCPTPTPTTTTSTTKATS